MNHDSYSDDYIRSILNSVKTIAMVGASPVEVRPSYFAFKYLVQRGYDMIPINPGQVGKTLLGRPFVASLSAIGRPIDMVEIFRSSKHIMPVVDQALQLDPLPKVIWMQLGGRDDEAAAKAEAAGAAERYPEHLVEMRPVAMPADADADVILGAQHLPHAAVRKFAKSLHGAGGSLEPFRDRLARLKFLQRVVVAEAERFHAPVAFERTELERLQGQRRNARDQFLLIRCRDELRLIAQPCRAYGLVIE